MTQRSRVAACVLLSLSWSVACTDLDQEAAPPPEAEFLVAAGDSTYWVRAGREGIRVRAAPLVLTRSGDTFYELRIHEAVLDYTDAEFIEERLFGYPIGDSAAHDDSTLIFVDADVASARARWTADHPNEMPIDPLEDDAPEPESVATDYLEVFNVHGPWVSWGHSLDIDLVHESGHAHRRRRGVSHARTGAAASLATLLSAGEAARIAALGQQTFARMLEEVRSAADERAMRARETLGSFVFDESAFSLTDVDRQMAIAFHLSGNGPDGEALELLLPPIAVQDSVMWWANVRITLPVWAADSGSISWTVASQTVRGVLNADRSRVALSLDGSRQPNAQNAKSWPLIDLPLPLYQFIPLGDALRDEHVRAALDDAFDRASEADPFASRAMHQTPARAGRVPQILRTTRALR